MSETKTQHKATVKRKRLPSNVSLTSEGWQKLALITAEEVRGSDSNTIEWLITREWERRKPEMEAAERQALGGLACLLFGVDFSSVKGGLPTRREWRALAWMAGTVGLGLAFWWLTLHCIGG